MAQAGPIANQTVTFTCDTNNDGTDETYSGTTDAQGVATVAITSTVPAGSTFPYTANWDGVLISAADNGVVSSPAAPHVVAVTPALAVVQNQNLPLSTITVRFDEDVQITSADVTVLGLTVGARNDFAFSYDTNTFTATLNWSTPLANDTYRLTVADSVTGLDQVALDGDQVDPLNPSLPSGDGQAGGNFVGVIYRLVGDINTDRSVNVADLQALAAAWASGPGYGGSADLNADGYVNVGDLQILVTNWGDFVPVGP